MQVCTADANQTSFDSYPHVEDSSSEGLSDDDVPQVHNGGYNDDHNELHIDGDNANQLASRTFSESSGNEESDIYDIKVSTFLWALYVMHNMNSYWYFDGAQLIYNPTWTLVF